MRSTDSRAAASTPELQAYADDRTQRRSSWAAPVLRVRRLVPEATLPAYAHPGDAGLDLSAAVEVVLEPGQARLIATGISVELPPGTEAQIRPRSGLALRHSVTVLNTPGTIDEGYRGEVGVVLINHGTRSVKVERGMRIAQLVVAARLEVEVREVEALSKADRGAAGFGSTGGFEVERAPAMEPRVSPRERP